MIVPSQSLAAAVLLALTCAAVGTAQSALLRGEVAGHVLKGQVRVGTDGVVVRVRDSDRYRVHRLPFAASAWIDVASARGLPFALGVYRDAEGGAGLIRVQLEVDAAGVWTPRLRSAEPLAGITPGSLSIDPHGERAIVHDRSAGVLWARGLEALPGSPWERIAERRDLPTLAEVPVRVDVAPDGAMSVYVDGAMHPAYRMEPDPAGGWRLEDLRPTAPVRLTAVGGLQHGESIVVESNRSGPVDLLSSTGARHRLGKHGGSGRQAFESPVPLPPGSRHALLLDDVRTPFYEVFERLAESRSGGQLAMGRLELAGGDFYAGSWSARARLDIRAEVATVVRAFAWVRVGPELSTSSVGGITVLNPTMVMPVQVTIPGDDVGRVTIRIPQPRAAELVGRGIWVQIAVIGADQDSAGLTEIVGTTIAAQAPPAAARFDARVRALVPEFERQQMERLSSPWVAAESPEWAALTVGVAAEVTSRLLR